MKTFGIALAFVLAVVTGPTALAQSSVSGGSSPSAIDRLNGIQVQLQGNTANLDLKNLQQHWPAAVHTQTERAAHRPGDQRGTVRTQTVQSVDYDQLIPLLIRAVQEQQTLIEKQQAEIERLKGPNL